MSKFSKIIVTIFIVFIFIGLSAVNTGIQSDAGSKTPGIFGLILFAGLIGGIRAIWKKEEKNKKDEKKDENDKYTLQK